ncbi:hypothetical protein MNEG_13917 [Monoraphidium neglectum]|uniref:Uncharacterized protein n=1 Tax=Monoraphidium neglectum TaxID=145388 RepID=A0A0D2LWZ5_9CHLO|nr:hypothetical protein MNEG_13917 [Monoraphidium neglectum]KIY94046.1 hypothetical protein MNEG_13917 [Monoraphidium neglectum]|eukprot:XP_013893066.1 hypothetical protein MNEG_13917 [Monoraphidium neglectum]
MSSAYSAVWDTLPRAFVGMPCQLQPVVHALCEEVELSFLEAGRPCPPWRSWAATINRWMSDQFVDYPVPGPAASDEEVATFLERCSASGPGGAASSASYGVATPPRSAPCAGGAAAARRGGVGGRLAGEAVGFEAPAEPLSAALSQAQQQQQQQQQESLPRAATAFQPVLALPPQPFGSAAAALAPGCADPGLDAADDDFSIVYAAGSAGDDDGAGGALAYDEVADCLGSPRHGTPSEASTCFDEDEEEGLPAFGGRGAAACAGAQSGGSEGCVRGGLMFRAPAAAAPSAAPAGAGAGRRRSLLTAGLQQQRQARPWLLGLSDGLVGPQPRPYNAPHPQHALPLWAQQLAATAAAQQHQQHPQQQAQLTAHPQLFAAAAPVQRAW